MTWKKKWMPVDQDLLVSRRANSSRFVILSAVNIRTIIECTISFLPWSSPSLIHKMPVKTSERSVSCTFVLEEKRTLLYSKLLQVPMFEEA